MNQIYVNIKERRTELGMSQEKLAKMTGYSDRSIIAKIEKGLVNLSYDKILLFAQALHLDPEELMGWTEPEDVGTVLADIALNPQLLSCIKKISELPLDKQISVYDYVDFVCKR